MIEGDDDYSDTLSITNKDSLRLLKADIMRRAKCYTELIEEFSSQNFVDGRLNDYLQFELEKAKQRDNKCYCTDEVPVSNLRPVKERLRVSLGELPLL
ncbi:hypothetical protein [Butyrivibrio sp. AE3004]|uniref:hypothetical protein n=1 Tax=Butyrivibrio sp. AE3004 TaxID=1506994 RepID=UPI000493F135|nr:hypothetical protein [Butyrivibrio sp. AE3004]